MTGVRLALPNMVIKRVNLSFTSTVFRVLDLIGRFFGDDIALAELNVRIIAADRPGYGLSDFRRGRKILDWPEDVAELADKLHIEPVRVSWGFLEEDPTRHLVPTDSTIGCSKVGIVCGMGP